MFICSFLYYNCAETTNIQLDKWVRIKVILAVGSRNGLYLHIVNFRFCVNIYCLFKNTDLSPTEFGHLLYMISIRERFNCCDRLRLSPNKSLFKCFNIKQKYFHIPKHFDFLSLIIKECCLRVRRNWRCLISLLKHVIIKLGKKKLTSKWLHV